MEHNTLLKTNKRKGKRLKDKNRGIWRFSYTLHLFQTNIFYLLLENSV